MSIQVSGNTYVIEYDPDVTASKIFWGHAFVDHRDVPRDPSQSLTQSLGGSRNVIDQSQISKFSHLTEVKSKIPVLQRARGEIQKPDLTLDTESRINILDLLSGQPCFLQKRSNDRGLFDVLSGNHKTPHQ